MELFRIYTSTEMVQNSTNKFYMFVVAITIWNLYQNQMML